jgi:predicted enzyme related to lactoylglutathione lyase
MLHTICHFEIPADDLALLEKFYGDLFGWTFERMEGPVEYSLIKTGEDTLGGGMMTRQMPEQSPVNYVLVESVDDSTAQAEKLGATVIVPRTAVPGMGWFAVLMDPQRNPFGLWQEDTNAA